MGGCRRDWKRWACEVLHGGLSKKSRAKKLVGRAYSKLGITASIIFLISLNGLTYHEWVITFYILDSINILSRYEIYVTIPFTDHNL